MKLMILIVSNEDLKKIKKIWMWLPLLQMVPEEIYRVLEEGGSKEVKSSSSDVPQSLEEFVAEMKSNRFDAKTFALRLKAMVCAASILILHLL